MALQYNAAGSVLVSVQSSVSGSLTALGYTLNGVTINGVVYYGDVPCDEEGGLEGPPGDIQAFGKVDHILLVLTKYEPTVASLVKASVAGLAEGVAPTPGQLLLQGATYWRLLLLGTAFTRNYTKVLFREPRQENQGAKFTTLVLTGTAYRNSSDSNKLWNVTSS